MWVCVCVCSFLFKKKLHIFLYSCCNAQEFNWGHLMNDSVAETVERILLISTLIYDHFLFLLVLAHILQVLIYTYINMRMRSILRHKRPCPLIVLDEPCIHTMHTQCAYISVIIGKTFKYLSPSARNTMESFINRCFTHFLSFHFSLNWLMPLCTALVWPQSIMIQSVWVGCDPICMRTFEIKWANNHAH